jgi:hypothetical protein
MRQIDAFNEIIRFVEPQKGYSYYDLKRYADENNKEEWIAALRNKNTRTTVALYLRSKRRKDKTPYKPFYGYTDEEWQELKERNDEYKPFE